MGDVGVVGLRWVVGLCLVVGNLLCTLCLYRCFDTSLVYS